MEKVKEYILSQVVNHKLSKEEAKELLLELLDGKKESITPYPEQETNFNNEDIAIIGLAGRFAKANNTEEFWSLLRNGENCITDYPQNRKNDFKPIISNPLYSEFIVGKEVPEADTDSIYSLGGYIPEIDKFDAEFFGIAPTEVLYMDPNQRIALEVAWETLEDAGYGGNSIKGTKTGVYVGRDHTNHSYYRLYSERHSMQLIGSWEGMVASRISYLHDFKGPSMVVDTACSGGLVSVHLGIQGLLAGECDMALAGGVNISPYGNYKPQYMEGATMDSVESVDGAIRTFDSRANGTVWGEGVCFVAIKKLSKAIQDGDHIQAVIKASAINNDGKTNSLTAPNAQTQEMVIVDAWKKAGISPDSISYVEAHGTGTVLGDPIEVKGLSNAFKQFTSKKQFCAIGSLKSNFGHMVAASGMASIAKVVKAMEHKELPPTCNFDKPNPYINFIESPLYINNTLKSWNPETKVRRAAINSFGFLRTSCHMVIEEGPEYVIKADKKPIYCFTVSALSHDILLEYIKKYKFFMNNCKWSLGDICYTSNIGRGHYNHRLIIMASTKDELKASIDSISEAGLSQDKNIAFGFYKIVNNKKNLLEENDITEKRKIEISELAMYKLEQYLNRGEENVNLLNEVCQLYVSGADVDWSVFNENSGCTKVPLPYYPFKKSRYWAKPMVSKVDIHKRVTLHPLVDKEIATSNGELCYESTLSSNKNWVLSDHKIMGHSVFPGTGYIEMVRFVMHNNTNSKEIELSNVFFLEPLMVDEDEFKKVRLQLIEISSQYQFNISSYSSGQWVKHVEGFAKAFHVPNNNETLKNNKINIGELLNRAVRIDEKQLETSATHMFNFGPHWKVGEEVYQIGDTTLAHLKLDKQFASELLEYKLHPSLLDYAVNLTSQSTGEMYLPYMYKTFKYFAPLTEELYVIIKTNHKENSETITYNIELTDLLGNLLVKINDYTIKKVHSLFTNNLNNDIRSCSQVSWVPINNRDKNINNMNEKWALITLKSKRTDEIELEMRKYNKEVKIYYLEDQINLDNSQYGVTADGIDLIAEDIKKSEIQGIIMTTNYAIEASNDDIFSNDVSEQMKKYSVDALFFLGKSIVKYNIKLEKGLIIVGKNGWYVDGTENIIHPYSASMASLALVISQELKHIKVNIIDVEQKIESDAVVKECFEYEGNGIRVIRSNRAYVQQLQHKKISITDKYGPNDRGVYIISGGLGGLGLAIAKSITSKAKAKIILLGRRKIEREELWEKLGNSSDCPLKEEYSVLNELKEKVEVLEYIAIDVLDNNAVIKLKNYIKNKFGRIEGIFHAAGLAGDGFLMNKSQAVFNSVADVKITGSINMLRMLDKEDGFIVFFSSIVSLTAGEGQSDYCAGNSFMDSLCEYAKKRGVEASAINWPGWKEVGISAKRGLKDEHTLFTQLSVKEGIEWLWYLVKHPESLFVPTTINKVMILDKKEELVFTLSPEINEMLKEVQNKVAQPKIGMQETKNSEIRDITGIQNKISKIYSEILGIQEMDIYTSFQELGGNSLMSSNLLKLVDVEFPGMVDIVDLFTYSTVSDLSEYIATKVLSKESNKSTQSGKIDIDDKEIFDLIKSELEGSNLLDLINNQ